MTEPSEFKRQRYEARPRREASFVRFERESMAWPPSHGSWPSDSERPEFEPLRQVQEPLHRPDGTLRDIVETLLLTVLIAFGIQFAVQSRLVEGSSMEPTLHNGQRLLINRLSYASLSEPQRGDIIVFRAWDQQEDFIKRVIGVPGDEIEIQDRTILVNGSQLDEPYLDQAISYGHIGPLVLPADRYYVMGDNRGNSSDSRLHGPLSQEQILGKAWVSYWPFENLGFVSDSTSYAAPRR